MGELVAGDDGLPVEEVGVWAKDKLASLCRYVDISRGVRSKWITQGKAGATYIDLFCGPGRSTVRRTGEYFEGSCVAAWNASVKARSPFSRILIGDADATRRSHAAERLRRLNAPVIEIPGNALAAAASIQKLVAPNALNFAFVDPYNLSSFDFGIVRHLSTFRYMDILVHISKMDLQRNVGLNIVRQQSAFDIFAPGWRGVVNTKQRHAAVRRDVFSYWQTLVSSLGVFPSSDMQLITGDQGQHLYWLTLAARHELAHKFWKIASNKSGQGEFSF